MKIDVVSDVVCPWCVIGAKTLEQALAKLGGEVTAEVSFHPFELNPQLGPEGRDLAEHLQERYGATPEQMAATRETLRARGAEVGFTFSPEPTERIYNTFDAHRLLHWASLSGKQPALQQALWDAYFTNGENPGDHDLLADVAASVGLDHAEAVRILAGNEYQGDVVARMAFFHEAGIKAVPAFIINNKHLISGAQSLAYMETALREIAQQS
ncbi:MAG: DsbA family oxidoreductase [Pseudomonadota bacterium]